MTVEEHIERLTFNSKMLRVLPQNLDLLLKMKEETIESIEFLKKEQISFRGKTPDQDFLDCLNTQIPVAAEYEILNLIHRHTGIYKIVSEKEHNHSIGYLHFMEGIFAAYFADKHAIKEKMGELFVEIDSLREFEKIAEAKIADIEKTINSIS